MKSKTLHGEYSLAGNPSQREFEFCGFRFPWLKGMKYLLDGAPGMRTLFIADKRKKVTISFEEGMQCLDQSTKLHPELKKVQSEYKDAHKYLHQVKIFNAGRKESQDLVYFHMEVLDKAGKLHICPGQMLLPIGCRGQDGPEPLLMSILSGLRIAES